MIVGCVARRAEVVFRERNVKYTLHRYVHGYGWDLFFYRDFFLV